MVRTVRAELGHDHGTVKRVADQLGYGTESVRLWVCQADIDEGHEPGVSTAEAARELELEQSGGFAGGGSAAGGSADGGSVDRGSG